MARKDSSPEKSTHRRVYDELSAKWIKALNACADLPHPPDADMVKTLYVSAWGGRRYLLLVQPQDIEASRWVSDMERLCCSVLQAPT